MLKRLAAGGTILMLALEIPSPSYAHTASQITPPSFAPPQPPVDAPIVIPQGLGPQAPAGTKAVELQLGDVSVEGAAIDPRALGELPADEKPKGTAWFRRIRVHQKTTCDIASADRRP